MGYKLVITRRAEELLDGLVNDLLFDLGNEPAAARLLGGVEDIYSRLEQNPLQFPASRDRYLSHKDYREVLVPGMGYRLVFCVRERTVIVLGIFHQLENFQGRVM